MTTRDVVAPGRPRVLHVGKFYTPFKGGIETHLRALCSGLRSIADVRVLVANETWRTERARVDGVEVVRLGTLFQFASTPVSPGLRGHIRAANADLVHLHWPHPAAAVAYLSSGHRGPLVVGYHSDIVRQKVLGRLFEPMLNRLLERSAAIVAATSAHIDYSPVLPRFRDRCHVIPYGIPVEAFEHCDPAEVASIRERYGVPIVLAVGRLVYYKGFEYLIHAMTGVAARLLIAGTGPLRRPLEQRAQEAGVADRVIFLGEQSDLVPYYHAADVFVLPSVARAEGFGLVQVEAMAAGTPVVNTRLESGAPLISLDGVTGLTVPPADPAALTAAITRLLADPELCARFGATGRQRARQEFAQEVMVRRTAALYRELLARKRTWSRIESSR